jgi:hypothetical protein
VIAKRNSDLFPTRRERSAGRGIRHARRKKDSSVSDKPIYWFFVIAALAYILGSWLWSLLPPSTWQR